MKNKIEVTEGRWIYKKTLGGLKEIFRGQKMKTIIIVVLIIAFLIWVWKTK